MTNISKYITWKPKKVNDYCYKHPNTDDRVNIETVGDALFYETGYQIADGRFISVVEHGTNCSEEDVEHFKTLDPTYEFTFIDETTANTLLSELGDVTVSNYVFSDNRPVPEI